MYNTEILVIYSSDEEYREYINRVFNIELSEDEYFYDNDAISGVLDTIYEKTKDNVLFVSLYERGAAQFLSTDLEVGLASMFAYNYFGHFHCILCEFLKYNALDESNLYYRKLIKLLTKN
jgi:hypothetical protein